MNKEQLLKHIQGLVMLNDDFGDMGKWNYYIKLYDKVKAMTGKLEIQKVVNSLSNGVVVDKDGNKISK